MTLQLWSHGGTPEERTALNASITAFHTAHRDVDVQVKIVSEGDYTTTLQEAVAAHQAPDVMDIDGPVIASFAAQDALRPLDALLPGKVVTNLSATLRAQGTWHQHLWAAGQFDSGLGIWADLRALHQAGIRVPSGPTDAWTATEFTHVLRRLAARDPDHRVLDLKLDYGKGEWMTYGFYPLVTSAGGDIQQLDTRPVLDVLTALSSWRPYVDADGDGRAFTSRRAPLSWVGHWTYPDYRAALGNDLTLLPLPDFGHGSKTGSGSWAWAVSARTQHAAAAGELLTWFERDSEVARITAANGALPGTATALRQSPLDDADNPLHLYVAQRAADGAVSRPTTPDYPTLTAAFGGAVYAVLQGQSPSTAQEHAVHATA